MDERTVNIRFVTDYVCPYCIVGKEALKRAAQNMGLKLSFETLALELTVPPAERVDTYHDEVRRANYRILEEPIRAMGLDIKLPPNIVPRPYTHKAFLGHYYALDCGMAEAYDDAVYTAYFTDEKDIEDIDVLTQIAASAGMDPISFKNDVISGAKEQEVLAADAYTKRELKVRTIPAVYIGDKKYQFENYTVEEAEAMLMAQMAAASAGFTGCGPDGCF